MDVTFHEMPPNNADICRLCLSIDRRMFPIAGSSLQIVFENITKTKLDKADRKPLAVCYICHAHLKKCHNLMNMSAKAELVLTAILKNCDQVTKESISLMDNQLTDLRGKLTLSKPDWIDTTLPPATVEVKIEPETDDLFIAPTCTDSEMIIVHSDALIDSASSNVEIKVEDFVECSDVTIVEVKTEDEIDIEGMEKKFDGSSLALSAEDSDVDIENLPNTENGSLLDKNRFEYASNVILKKGVAANMKTKPKKKSRTDKRIYECHVCQHRFHSSWHLSTHTRSHTGEKPYQCNKCQRNFSEKSSLNSHLLIHTGVKPFECNICQRSFSKKNHLNRHLTIHSDSKPFECNVCGHKFFDKSGLECHLRIHSDEKPFECDLCHRRFNYKHVLMKHLRVHTGEKPYSCDICRYSSARRFNLQVHLKKMHGRDTFKKSRSTT